MTGFVQGSCEDMCPAFEIKLRTKEHLLHFFELKPGEKYSPGIVVKAFSRSAAGVKTPRKTDLRTPRALQKTVEYLLKDIVLEKRKSFSFVYDFIFDRLRCVRQEIVMQNLDNKTTIKLLQPTIMFLAYARYRLREEPIDKFDPKICDQHLQECLKKILCCYDEERVGEKPEDSISAVQNRCFIESLYQIFNIGSSESLNRALHLSKSLKYTLKTAFIELVMILINYRDDGLNLSISLSLEYYRGNFYKVLNGLDKLPHLLSAIGCLKLPEIRRKMYEVFSHAYSSKQLFVKIEWLKKIGLYSSEQAVVRDCKHYSIEVLPETSSVRFLKTNFNVEKELLKVYDENFVEKKFKPRYLPEILLLKKL